MQVHTFEYGDLKVRVREASLGDGVGSKVPISCLPLLDTIPSLHRGLSVQPDVK